jgi:MinD superfamily P-loop ATPase
MRTAIASGKGGTGKTTVATSLALSLAQGRLAPIPPLFLDCAVEAPNAHLFLNLTFERGRDWEMQRK